MIDQSSHPMPEQYVGKVRERLAMCREPPAVDETVRSPDDAVEGT